ncbi:MAG: PAS domain S-box protein [Peptococcaceae bacterium]|nr:PAS domain S-box protein [Peptococcaceae bacterium]
MDKHISGKTKLYEYVTTTHILCIIIAISALILSNNVEAYSSYYPAINARFLALMCLLGFAIILLYNSKKMLLARNPASFTLIDAAYVGVSFLITIFTVYIIGDRVPFIHTILLLPVIITASSLGKKIGLIIAAFSTIFLVYSIIVTGLASSLAEAVQSSLILIMIMYVIGWFIGGLKDMETERRLQLENNLHTLQEEIERRKQAEEQQRKLSRALEQSPGIIAITDTDGNIEYVNQKFTTVTGYLSLDIIGRNMFREHFGQSKDKHQEMLEMVGDGKEWQGELKGRKKNGEQYWAHLVVSPFKNKDGTITHYIQMAEDITQAKKIDLEMARLERLNLVGEMAAGIGHEIRNPMTTIRGFLQLMGGKEKYIQDKKFLDLMIDELDRANAIITEYLSLAKNRLVKLEVENLNRIIASLYPLIAADGLVTDKTIEKDLGRIPDLLLDGKEMRQMILNLVRNGLEAMSPGGTLVLKTFVQGDEVVMAVKDQGKGINPEMLEKIGDPFFTTKDEGTGLGLAVCYSIAARHNARIEIDTSPAGTTFFIRFKQPEVAR